MRAQECEKKTGVVSGDSNKVSGVITDRDCKNTCDQNIACWGWTFDMVGKTCAHYSSVNGFTSKNGYSGGSCYCKCLEEVVLIIGFLYLSIISSSTLSLTVSMVDERSKRIYSFHLVPLSPYPDVLPLKTFRQQSLDQHNQFRKMHCRQELTLNDDLNESSQDYAERLATFGKKPPNYSGIRMENLHYQALDYKLDGKSRWDV